MHGLSGLEVHDLATALLIGMLYAAVVVRIRLPLPTMYNG
jgi:hypothetical protein